MQENAEKAIRAALEGKWEEAVEFNLALLKEEPNDIAALNRLARAHTELGELDEAQTIYKKVVSFDKYNPIATKGLKRLKAKAKKKSPATDGKPAPIIRSDFLEEPGKTKTTQLVRLSDANVLAGLQVGQSVYLEAKKRSVSVKLEDETYIGSLPDDLSFRLGKLMRGGNRYEALIKGLPDVHGVSIFIRETNRSKRFKNTPSFPTSGSVSYLADLRRAVIKETPIDTRETGEGES